MELYCILNLHRRENLKSRKMGILSVRKCLYI